MNHRSIKRKPLLLSTTLFVLLLCGCALFGADDSNADEANAEGQPFIDLDGDGTIDFALERTPPMGHEYAVGSDVRIVPKRDNEVVINKKMYPFLAAFEENTVIGEALADSLVWVSRTSDRTPILYKFTHYNYPDSSSVMKWRGGWPSEKAKYLGLKLVENGTSYYGWARIHVDSSVAFGRVSVTARGYNPGPRQSIRAGQKEDE